MSTLNLDLNGSSTAGVNDTTTFTGSPVTLFSAAAFSITGGSGKSADMKSISFNLQTGDSLIIPTGGNNANFSVSNVGNLWTITYNNNYGQYNAADWTNLLDTLQFTSTNTYTSTNPDTITVAGATDYAGNAMTLGSGTVGSDTVQCFYPGTLIRTPDGEVAVETLKPGDSVLTADGVAKQVNWLGRQTVSTIFSDKLRALPIRIKAGALAENVPARDLLVSPAHALLVDGVLINAGALVNGASIVRETRVPRVFTYYNIELDDHSLILAENVPAETFVDSSDREHYDNWAEYEALYPEGKVIDELPYPRAKSHRQVPVYIRVALADRAQTLGAAEAAVA